MGLVEILKHSFWICWKDILEFSRSKLRLIMLVVMPLFMMVMVGFIFPSSQSVEDQPIALANLDSGSNGTFLSQSFIAGLKEINNRTGMMILSDAKDFSDIKEGIRNGKISGGIIIGENFTKRLMEGGKGSIQIVPDQTNPQLSLMIETVLSQVIDELGTARAYSYLNNTHNITIERSKNIIKPYEVEVRGIVPGDPNYFQFVAPGIMAMVVMMSLMTGLPHAISYEKDIGTLDGMLVAPINRLSIITGKVMAQTTRGMVQGTMILLLAIFLFDVRVYGSLPLVFFLLILGVFSFVGLGILITSFTENEETASMVMMTLMFPMMFLSGVFFPIQQMPWFMQRISQLLPLTYATRALRKVIILNAGISEISTELLVMAGFGVVLLAIAVPMFKKAMTR